MSDFTHSSVYEMVFCELVEGNVRFKNFSLLQKRFIAEKLTAHILAAEVDNPVSVADARAFLDQVEAEALLL